MDTSREVDILVYRVKMAARMLLVVGVVSIATLLARFTNASKISLSWWNASISHIWLFFVIISFVNLWWTIGIVAAVRNIVLPTNLNDIEYQGKPASYKFSDAECKAIFDKIATQESLFLNGLIPRHAASSSSRIVKMSLSDTTSWLAFGLAIAAIAAILPWTLHGSSITWPAGVRETVAVGSLTALLVVFNWICGSTWIATLSQLALPQAERWPYDTKTRVALSGPEWQVGRIKTQDNVLLLAWIGIPLVLIVAPTIVWIYSS